MKTRQVVIGGILALVLFAILFVVKRSRQAASESGVSASGAIVVSIIPFELPVVLTGDMSRLEDVKAPVVSDLADLNVRFLSATKWEEVTALHIQDKDAQSAMNAGDAKSYWEKKVAENPSRSGKGTTLFSCVVVVSADGEMAWSHAMGGPYSGAILDAPGFPFMGVKGYRRNGEGVWRFDKRLNQSEVTKALLQLAPARMKDSAGVLKFAVAKMLNVHQGSITVNVLDEFRPMRSERKVREDNRESSRPDDTKSRP